jgi:hypothetical protein
MTEDVLPEIVTAAALALERMDVDLAARPEGASLWIWPISETERRLVRRLQKQYPADGEMRWRVSRVLDEYLESTTADHVAFMAVHALAAAAKALKLVGGR